MSDTNRAQWLTILEAASVSPPDQLNAEWEWLMNALGLSLDYWLGVREAIQQGRWRKAKNPRGYVKTVAKREAVKMGLVESTDEGLVLVSPRIRKNGIEVTQTEVLGELFHEAESSEPVRGADVYGGAVVAPEAIVIVKNGNLSLIRPGTISCPNYRMV